MVEHGGDDADFLLVSGRIVADEFLLAHYLAVHEAFEGKQAFVYLLFLQTIHLTDEVEVFFGGEVVYQETVVYKGSREVLPVLTFADVNVIDGYIAPVCLQQVKNQTEEGGLACTVVAYQSQHIALPDGVVLYIYGFFCAEILL